MEDGVPGHAALIFEVTVSTKKWMLGFSYDKTVSGLKTIASSSNSLELSFKYTFPEMKINAKSVNNERY